MNGFAQVFNSILGRMPAHTLDNATLKKGKAVDGDKFNWLDRHVPVMGATDLMIQRGKNFMIWEDGSRNISGGLPARFGLRRVEISGGALALAR